MDFTIHRRAGAATYGKNRNKVLVHNFFDEIPREKPAPTPVPIAKLPITPSSASSTEAKHEPIAVQPLSPSPAPRLAHITTHSTSSRTSGDVSRSVSPLKPSRMAPVKKDLSVFDLSASEEEKNEDANAVPKRRKLKHVARVEELPESAEQPIMKKLQSTQQVLPTTRDSKLAKRVTKKADEIPTSVPVVITKNTKPTRLTTERVGSLRTHRLPEKRAGITSAKPREVVPISSSSEGEDILGVQNEKAAVKPSRSKLRKPPPRPLTHTIIQHTPKKPQDTPLSHDTPSPSPSHLAMVDLQLSSNSPSPQAITTTIPLPRGRKRLIDRLDAPSTNPSRSKSPVATAEPVRFKEPLEKPARPTLERSNSSQARQKFGKPRNVYGRERSHLADMVDDLDMLNAGSSQEASQQLVSQLAAVSQSSQLHMEFELESDSSDDMITGGKLKSIHELRQAGSISRFERDLEALMEDVDSSNKNNSTAVRLQALVKMIKKCADNDFVAFVYERGFDRLTSWYSPLKDSLSKLFEAILLWRMSHLKNISTVNLVKIVTVLTSSTSSLTLESLKDMTKDQEKVLSKSMIRDLTKFEQEVTSQRILPSYSGRDVLPAAVILGTLSHSLRQLLDSGETEISIPRRFLVSILTLLNDCTHRDLDTTPEIRLTIHSIFSILEMSTGPLNIALNPSSGQNTTLAENLGWIVEASLDKHDELVQSALRFAISFCNNRPDICSSFSTTQFVQSQTRIIRTRFLRLVGAAERAEEIRQDMVDSIILCLACLLNLTEHEDGLRRQVAHTRTSASAETTLEALVSIYKSAAPAVVGATTDGHGQVLVAFGYLSLLLCTLSLASDVRGEMDSLLGSYTMTDVVVSGKELLIHLSTLDAFQGLEDGEGITEKGAPEMDEFTKRFGQILSAVPLS